MQPVTVAVVNDYELVVQGVAAMLAPYADRVRVVELEAGGLPETPVQVALYDTFAAEHGAEVEYDEVLASIGRGRLAIYCWHMDPVLVEGALRAGASGYLSKRLPATDLVDAVIRIAGGEIVVSKEYFDDAEVVEYPPGDWPGKAEGLSERESEVVALIADGLSNEQVADKAFLSINTVKSYIRTAYRKMDVTSRSQAVIWAVDHGFRRGPRRDHSRDDLP